MSGGGPEEPVRADSQACSKPGPDALDDIVRSIADHARAANRARGAALADALSGVVSTDGVAQATDLAHQISGSAGTFGYAQASAIASELETLLTGSRLDPSTLAVVRAMVAELNAVLAGEPTD